MISQVRGHGVHRLKEMAFTLVFWSATGSIAFAFDDNPGVSTQKIQKSGKGLLGRRTSTSGTLGYGASGLHPGFFGFGLGFHPGYGYGGDGLGVGAEGGYPFYGGPGYPHPWPVLRRFKYITPFPYYGGPGGPSPTCPNFFGETGPLFPDQPVITIANEGGAPAYTDDYGAFTGVLPYPESTFAPFTSSAATYGTLGGGNYSTPPAPPSGPVTEPGSSYRATPVQPSPGPASALPAQRDLLGIDDESVVDPTGVSGLRVSKVYPQSAAEKAGLRAGDVIQSINGYVTVQPGNLTWIIANAAPDRALKISVRTSSDGVLRTIAAQLP